MKKGFKDSRVQRVKGNDNELELTQSKAEAKNNPVYLEPLDPRILGPS